MHFTRNACSNSLTTRVSGQGKLANHNDEKERVIRASRTKKQRLVIGIKERLWVPGGRNVSSWHRCHVPSYQQQGGPFLAPLSTAVNWVGV